MTRRLAVVPLVAAALALVIAVLVRDSQRGELIVVQDVPPDVRAELDFTWGRFVDVFGTRRGCFDDVSVVLVRDVVGGDARYVTAAARIEIEIPTTPARFRESLTHELGHHVEHTCAEFADARAAILARLGLGEDAWSGGDVWERTPSEIWAEGVVALVNGERILHGEEMPIDASIEETIAAWARGDALSDLSR